jgi:predicted AlkP superfamily pyrophosphatase or phosphodiesterase
MEKVSSPGMCDAAEKLIGPNWPEALGDGDRRDALLGKLAEKLLLEQKPNLLLLHLVEPDKIQHQYGVSSHRVSFSMHRVDGIIKRLRSACEKARIDEETAFVIVGDHGFADVSWSIAPNTLLAEQGFLTVSEGRLTQWTAYVQNTGGSAAVHLNDPRDAAAQRKVKKLLQERGVGPDGEPLYALVERKEADAKGAPARPAFFLEAAPGYMFSSATSGPLVRGSPLAGNHGYWPDNGEMKTGFIALGSGIRKRKLESIQLVDIAPTVARLLGIDFPDCDGRVLKEMLY